MNAAPTVSVIRRALALIGKAELRRRAEQIHAQQMNLGTDPTLLKGVCLELAARETKEPDPELQRELERLRLGFL